MPIYVYHCEDCNRTHEIIQKFSDAPLGICPGCGGPLHKTFSPEIGLSFKGSGFYITDYKNKASGTGAKPEVKKTTEASPTAAPA